jgi:hypothetical protein
MHLSAVRPPADVFLMLNDELEKDAEQLAALGEAAGAPHLRRSRSGGWVPRPCARP